MTLEQIFKSLKGASMDATIVMANDVYYVEVMDENGADDAANFETLKEAKDWLEEKIPT